MSEMRYALAEAAALLQGLSAAQQNYSMYPAGHPSRIDAVSEIARAAQRLVIVSDDTPVLFAARHNFYLGSTLMARESLALTRLLNSFEEAEVEAVEIFPNVTTEDVDALMRVVTGEPDAVHDLSGIAINRVRPTLGMQDEREQQLSETLITYGSGLELLRQSASRMSMGKPVDMNTTEVMVEQIADDVARDPMQALLVSTIKSYDEYTYFHMMNVCLLSIALGYGIGLDREQIVILGIGALLHDIGKVKVPKDVLTYAGPLSEEQWKLIKQHPVDGAGLIYVATRDLFHPSVSIVLEHHAAFDLKGYPELTNRKSPSMAARIIAVTDAFDALTSKRSYRQAEDRRQALNTLQASAGHRYDPRVLRAFTRLLGLFPIGSLVRLTTGETGMVVKNHDELLARPTIRLLLDSGGQPGEAVDLDLSEQDGNGAYKWSVEKTLAPEELGLDMAQILKTGRAEPAARPVRNEPAPQP